MLAAKVVFRDSLRLDRDLTVTEATGYGPLTATRAEALEASSGGLLGTGRSARSRKPGAAGRPTPRRNADHSFRPQ